MRFPRRLLLFVVAVLGAGALFAPQAMAGAPPGSPGSITVVPTTTNTGSAIIQGFELAGCTINGAAVTGDCVADGLTAGPFNAYILTATMTNSSTLIGFVNCPGAVSIPNPAVGGTCTFQTSQISGQNVMIGVGTSRSQTLTIAKSGNGTGIVTSNPAGISCGTTCSASFTPPQTVTLTAFPSGASAFAGWGGACAGAGTNPTCTTTLTQTSTVTASFTARPTYTFTISTGGPGSGVVTSSPSGLSCPPTCTAAVVGGTTLTLNPDAAPGSEFGGWSGSCTGLGQCAVTVNASGAVTATFNRAAVEAAVEHTNFTKRRRGRAKRTLHVNVVADEQVRVSLRIVRNGVVLASKVVPRFRAGDRNVNVRVRNGINSGRAQLRITFTDQFGNAKNQRRRIHIPKL